MSWLKTYLLPLLLALSLLEAKLPELTPKATKEKLEEILKNHASFQAISPDLMERIFVSYLDAIDPSKCYLFEEEVAPWTHPTSDLLEKAALETKQGNYALFHEIHQLFLKGIERRALLEEKIKDLPISKEVDRDEFKDLSKMAWCKDEKELETRILKIKSIQSYSAEKLAEEDATRLLQVIEKRRLNRENELKGDESGIEKVVLTYFLKAATHSLDSHTSYFTPSEANQFMIQVQQRLFGIGAQLRDDLDGLLVVRILENSPASKSGKIKINDKIIAVNHEPVIGLDITEAVELVRGPQGTPVLLTILRKTDEGTEKLEIELIRGEIVLEESRLETQVEPFGDGAILTLRLFSFYQDEKFSSASDIEKAFQEIKKDETIKGIILDLRGNGGGLLSQAVAVTGLFIKNGIVVSVKDNTGKVHHLRRTEGEPIWDGPLVVLVNKASASAAEIVAQTLQDYGRALIVGDERTFGKGSFQTFTLDPIGNPVINKEGEYKVTRGRYYTVSGKSPQLEGVCADIVVPGLLSKLEIGEKYSPFPLANDEIEAHFDDDLSDLSAFQRVKLKKSYRQNLQQPLQLYLPQKEKLQNNSKKRIGNNPHYQNFLSDVEKDNFDSMQVDLFGKHDLQHVETLNIMKDLIHLRETK